MKRYLQASELLFEERTKSTPPRLTVKCGTQKGSVQIYNSGKVVIQGPGNDLVKLLNDMKAKIDKGDAR